MGSLTQFKAISLAPKFSDAAALTRFVDERLRYLAHSKRCYLRLAEAYTRNALDARAFIEQEEQRADYDGERDAEFADWRYDIGLGLDYDGYDVVLHQRSVEIIDAALANGDDVVSESAFSRYEAERQRAEPLLPTVRFNPMEEPALPDEITSWIDFAHSKDAFVDAMTDRLRRQFPPAAMAA